MSWAATAYVKNIRLSQDGKKITKAQKLVLFVLADYHNEERGDAWASLRRIAEESLHTVSGTIRVIYRLEELGLIRVIRDPNAAKTRIANRYIFAALEMRATDPGSVGLLTVGQHIFPENLSEESLRKKDKIRRGVNPVETVDNHNTCGESSERFEQLSTEYPHRGGKRPELERTKAGGHYADGLKAQGLMEKDQKRVLLAPAGHEPWRDWLDPPVFALTERPPPGRPRSRRSTNAYSSAMRMKRSRICCARRGFR